MQLFWILTLTLVPQVKNIRRSLALMGSIFEFSVYIFLHFLNLDMTVDATFFDYIRNTGTPCKKHQEVTCPYGKI